MVVLDRNYRRPAAGEMGECPTCGFRGGPGYVKSDVPVGHPDFGKPVPCPTCHIERRVEKVSIQTRLVGELKMHRFNNFKVVKGENGNEAALAAAWNFAQGPAGWLAFYGDYGPGKTHLMASIANECSSRGIEAVYICMGELWDEVRHSYNDDYYSFLNRLMNVQVLLVDEVDWADLSTKWVVEKVVTLFENRYNLRETMGTCFAMNERPERRPFERGDVLGWLYSRINTRWGCKVVEVGGTDRRQVKRDEAG